MADKQTIIKYSAQMQLSNREITRQLGINRKMVDKYIREYQQSQKDNNANSSYYFESPQYSNSKKTKKH